MSSVRVRFRDLIKSYLPVWLSDKPGQFKGQTVGYREAWVLAASLDVLAERYYQSVYNMLGIGDPGALQMVGRTRGILRGIDDTNETYLARLQQWLAILKKAGTRRAIASQIRYYLHGHPQVEVINCGGAWTRCNYDGSFTEFNLTQTTGVLWSWGSSEGDGPSDLYVIVTGFGYGLRTGTPDTLTVDTNGTGLLIPQTDTDALRAIISQFRSAGSRIRCVIFAQPGPGNPSPNVATTYPYNGTWGSWGSYDGSNNYIKNPNRPTGYRYFEPN